MISLKAWRQLRKPQLNPCLKVKWTAAANTSFLLVNFMLEHLQNFLMRKGSIFNNRLNHCVDEVTP